MTHSSNHRTMVPRPFPSVIRVFNVLFTIPLALTPIACGDGGSGTDPALGKSAEPLTMSQTHLGLEVTVTTSGPLVQGVNNTYTWTATNVSAATLSGVGLGSNWSNSDGSAPIIKALGPGCANQSANDIPPNAALGIWCGSLTGVSLAPGASVSGWATIEDPVAGPVRYNLYSLYTEPQGAVFTVVNDTESAGAGPVDLQITGSSNNGSPHLDSSYTYTYQVKNAGPWSTSGGVSFTDVLPASLTFVNATTSTGACAGGQTVSCALGDLANGAHATVAITVTAPSTAQSIVNTASAGLSDPQSDTNVNNNAVTVTVASK